MPFPNCLAADCYTGDINGIRVEWADGAKSTLADQARSLGKDSLALKAVTEHLGHSTAIRLGKDRVRIMGSIHDTTTFSTTGEVKKDDHHISIKVMPGQLKVHIYVEGLNEEGGEFENIKVKGEGVVKPGQPTPDANLSTGSYLQKNTT